MLFLSTLAHNAPNAGQPEHEGRAERVGQHEPQIAAFGLEAPHAVPKLPDAPAAAHDSMVEPRCPAQHRGEVLADDENDTGAGEVGAHATEDRSGHYHVADPVGGPDADD